ncbi:MAG: heparinase II/III family protein [Chloroflexi bacterium]|nr:heparinase II/III family protein [Chloroflexota bacterium]
MLTEDVLDRARRRLIEPAFAAAVGRLRADVQADLARPILVPPPDRPAGYYHDYFCPQHGVQLAFDWHAPRAHRCPVDGAVYRGEPYDRSWWWFVNHAHSQAAFRLALAWRLAGDRTCLDRLGAIFSAYAAHYPQAGWPADDPRPRQGKVAFHALDEAVWLIPLAWAYALARPALPDGARRDVEARLLQPAAEHIVAQRWPQVHNYMCWLNAAIAAAGALLDRADLVSLAVDGPYGFHQQIRQGVLADGTWWENTASYHFYTLAAFLALIRSLPDATPAGVRSGGEPDATGLRRHPQIRSMFVAPLRWAYPDLSLPALNDCWYHSSLVGEVGHGIPPAAAFYEIAAGWYRDSAFGHILAANYGQANRPRDSLEALLFGPDDVAAAASEQPRRLPQLLAASTDIAELGVAVMRHPNPSSSRNRTDSSAVQTGARGTQTHTSTDPRTFALLKYGPHGGGHGHPDKLGLVFFASGERLSPDLGTPGYGIGLNDAWYRHTLSHNTVLIEGQPQPPAKGRLISFEPLSTAQRRRASDASGAPGAYGVIDAEVEWPRDYTAPLPGSREAATNPKVPDAYDGVRLRRRLLFRPNYFLDIFSVSCPSARQIEWAYHNLGSPTVILGSPSVILDSPSVILSGAKDLEAAAELRRSAQANSGPPPTHSRPGAAPESSVAGLPDFVHVRQVLPDAQDSLVAFTTGGAGLRLWLAGMGARRADPAATDLAPDRRDCTIIADAPANPASESMALLLRRCRAQQVVFAAVFEPHAGRPSVRAVTWQMADGTLTCRLQTRRREETWQIRLFATASRRSPGSGERLLSRHAFRYG